MNEIINTGVAGTQQTLTSIEVAEMVGKEHKVLLRDIKRYSKQMSGMDSIEDKIVLNDFWTESTYKDSVGRTLPCYIVTKKGCEFIAHKLTGTKGTQFTAAYINRFHEMENAVLKNVLSECLDRRLSAMEEQMKQIAQFTADVQSEKAELKTSENPENPVKYAEFLPTWGAYDMETESNLKEFNFGISTLAKLYSMSRNNVMRFLYIAMDKKDCVRLRTYQELYSGLTGEQLSTARVVCMNRKLFTKARDSINGVIQELNIFT